MFKVQHIIVFLLCGFPVLSTAQTLEQVIRLAQDSAITAFQSRYEYDYHEAQYDEFEALRKPQLNIEVVPNYSRVISDPSRNYVYLRNFDRLSAAAQIRLTQKMLGWGGEAYVGSQALWSEYLTNDKNDYSRDFVATPIILGYKQSLLGYNPYRWEKAVEDQRLKAARQQHSYELHLIAEEATRRFFRLACAQGMLDMCERNKQTADTLYAIAKEKASIAMVTLAELRSLELQRLNAANALETARNDEQVAREALLSYLGAKKAVNGELSTQPLVACYRRDARTERYDDLAIPDSAYRSNHTSQFSVLNSPFRSLLVPDQPKPLDMTADVALQLAKANSPAYQHQQTALIEARHQQQKASKESGVNVGLDVNVGLQQVAQTFGGAFKNQDFYMLGAVSVSVPLMDHGAAKKRYAAATAWKAREEQALDEVERALCEDVLTTLENLRSHQQLLAHTSQAVTMADDVFQLTADNYANGLCDINTYSLAQSRRDNAYNQHLTALEKYWTTYYHLLTLTQHE
jgi:outer membrane protein TolC